MSRYEMLEFTVEFLRETEKAIHVAHENGECWLPKSMIKWLGAAEEGDEIEVKVPRWLAEEKEME